MAARKPKRGRGRGGRNRGYFYRAGRGWCTSEGTRAIPLTNADGAKLSDPNTSANDLKDAVARYRLQRNTPAVTTAASDDTTTVSQACQLYLEHCKANGAASTYENRSDTLFDFNVGLPPIFKATNYRDNPDAEKERIHDGYGQLTISQLKPFHIDQWLAKHPTWDGGKRTKVQAIKRALNYAKKSGLIGASPLFGYKVADSNIRKTYLTEEQEAACYKYSKPDLATAIKVCIRTGARFGCEFSKLTAKHVKIVAQGVEWHFSAKESKTRKLRIIRIADPEIVSIVKEHIAKHPKGPIFRNSQGNPWKRNTLSQRFCALKRRLSKHGVQLDDDACMYSCRHTYAKRTLSGYWTGKPSNIETLSQLMGNSREVCWKHYAEWNETYTEPLWAVA